MPTHIIGAILSLAAFLSFSISDAGRKLLANDYDIVSIVFWASSFAVFLIIAIALIKGEVKSLFDSTNIKIKLLRSLFISINSFFAISAFYLLPMADAYIVILTAPLIVIIISYFLYGEKITIYKAMAIGVGFAGALVVIKPGFAELNIGYIAAMGCAIFFALGNSLIKKIGNKGGTLSHSLYPQIISVILGAIYLKLDITPISINDLPLIILASVMLIAGTSFMAWAVNKIESSEAMLYHYSQIIWGIVMGYIIFSDMPDLNAMIGASLVLVSGILIYANSKKNRANNR